MTRPTELSRVDYANHKHHRQVLREQISPQMIDKIEISPTPAQNYQNAFKGVFMDELQKTMQFQQTKKLMKGNYQAMSTGTLPYNGQMSQSTITSRGYCIPFTDYDQERGRKFDDHINRSYNGGSDFFNSQDNYQKHKMKQSLMTKDLLQQQLNMKQQQLLKENKMNSLIAMDVRYNQQKMAQMEQERQNKLKEWQAQQRLHLQANIEQERSKKQRKSYFKLGEMSRHNPITNPIEYHIDNPYILNKMQRHVY